MNEYEQALEDIKAARALIEQGWCQGPTKLIGTDGTTYRCLSEALTAAIVATPLQELSNNARFLEASTRIRYYLPKEEGNLIAFNDKPGRTKQEVLAKLDEVIAGESPHQVKA